ncbi:hypothetical protein ACM66B_006625 [Microbotryomycetes sp. NB124-2]
MSSIILAQQRGGLASNLPVDQLFTRKELVGKGAYGGVYKGVHNPTGLVVALKVIDLDTPEDDISEIQKEVALLSEMRDAARHNITLYHGCYLYGHELWIAMDFASGGSIRTLMKSGSIEEKYIVVIIREVLVALSFLHRQGIIHRDVKAANVLLTQAGKILLCDFGVAAHLQTNNKRSTFIGTPLWMAPEVITDGKLYDTKADIWSLGITCYEIATGNPPYFGMEPLRACALIPRSAPARLEGGAWSGPMRDFLAQCLQIDPVTRPSADEITRHKWIKAASKVSMSIMRELINRYVNWVQRGGQRASLAGVESLAREDTFDIEEDSWDFDGENEPFSQVETLGDEPPRSLDAQAAVSNKRPPKQILPRSHPLMRLFDEESNAYSAPKPATTINLPSGPVDTVRPTISIPSFDDSNGFYDSNPSSGINLSLVEDLMTPATIRSQPFSWLQQQQPTKLNFGGASSSNATNPFGDEDWGSSSFMSLDSREVVAPSVSTGAAAAPVPASPSMPTIPLDRPLQSPNRRRADTAPSSDYPPLGRGIPAFSEGSTLHSNQTSISSHTSTGNNSLFTNASGTSSFGTTTLSSSPPTISKPFPGSSSTTNGGPQPPFGRLRPLEQDVNRPFKGRQSSDAARQLKLGNGLPPPSQSSSASIASVNGESRSRTGSDASLNRKQGAAKVNGSGAVSHSRHHSRQHSRSHSRTGSGILAYKLSPSNSTVQLPQQQQQQASTSMHAWSAPVTAASTPLVEEPATQVSPPSHWTDEAFIQAAGGPSTIRTPLALAASGVAAAEPNSFPFPSSPSRGAGSAGHGSTGSAGSNKVRSGGSGGGAASGLGTNFRTSVIGRPGGAVLDLARATRQASSSDQVFEEDDDRFVEVEDDGVVVEDDDEVEEEDEDEEEEEEEDDESASSLMMSRLWPLGPGLQSLDYSTLATKDQVQGALDETLEQLGQWLDGIDRGLAKVVGVELETRTATTEVATS